MALAWATVLLFTPLSSGSTDGGNGIPRTFGPKSSVHMPSPRVKVASTVATEKTPTSRVSSASGHSDPWRLTRTSSSSQAQDCTTSPATRSDPAALRREWGIAVGLISGSDSE